MTFEFSRTLLYLGFELVFVQMKQGLLQMCFVNIVSYYYLVC